jgi:hypothetical protein
MKRKSKFLIILIISIILIVLIISGILFLKAKNEKLITADINNITSISVAEWQVETVVIKDKNTINELVNYLKSLKNEVSWHLGGPENWDFRIGIYESFEGNLSIMKESFYLTKDGKVYKNKYIYNLDDFDYNYFVSLLKQQ